MSCKICQEEIKEKYQLCKLLNEGSNSEVYLVCDSEKPKYVAKKFRDKNDIELETCQRINQIKNVNFAKYIDTMYSFEPIVIYEYIDGISLGNYMYESTVDEFFTMLIKIINQLNSLLEQNYYYLDINKSNIIIKDNKPYLIDYGTLTDKGLIEDIGNIFFQREYFGSFGLVPPEYFINKQLFPEKFDVFSIGIILFEKIYNFSPLSISSYYHLNCWFWCTNKDCRCRTNCLVDFMNKQTDKISEGQRYIILRCLDFEHKKRIDLTTLKLFLEILSY